MFLQRVRRLGMQAVAGTAIAVSGVLGLPVQTLALDTGWQNPTYDGPITWTRSTGTQSFANVDDGAFCNGTTDYNYTTVTGKIDWYGRGSGVPGGNTINTIKVIPCISSNGAGSSTIKVRYEIHNSSGLQSSGSQNYTVSGSTPTTQTTWTTSGLSISSASSSVKVGVEVVAGTGRVSNMRINLSY